MAAEGMNFNLIVAFWSISLGGLLFGYIIGITSNVVIAGQLLCEDPAVISVGTLTSIGYHQCYELSPFLVGALSSLNIVGALVSTLICFRFSEDLGRKLELQIGAVMYLVGAVIAAASPVLWGVFLGFFVYGLGVGFAMHAAPIFIGEMSPAEIRGGMVSAKEAVIVLGMCFGFGFGYLFMSIEVVGWRWMVAVSTPFSVAMLGAVSLVPESPRFLVLKALTTDRLLGKEQFLKQAAASLQWFRQAISDDVDEEIMAVRKDFADSVGAEVASWSDAFNYPDLLRIGCGIVLLQQVTGQPTVLYFASSIFTDAGLGEFASLSSLLVGLVKLAATCVSASRVDQYGRRFLLFVGISMMVVALAIVSFAFLFRVCDPETLSQGQLGWTDTASRGECRSADLVLPRGWGILTVAGLMIYVSGYQFGFGPISWVLISEIFPQRVRGAALSVAALVNFSSNIFMTLLQPTMLAVLSPSGVFGIYLLLSIVSLAFVKKYVPETRGKTLEEVEAMLAKGALY